MFGYELVYYVETDRFYGNVCEDRYMCLLLPELIKDVFNKINSTPLRIKRSNIEENGKFENGYAILWHHNNIVKVVREDGKVFDKIPDNTEYCGLGFCDDRLLVTVNGHYAYIDGISGKIFYLPEEFGNVVPGSYSCGYAIITCDEKKSYIDKDLNKKSIEYEYASPFLQNRALVCTDSEWQIIDDNFAVLLDFPREKFKDEFFKGILFDIEEESKNSEMGSLISSYVENGGRDRIYIFQETGISIFMGATIKKIAEILDLKVPELSIKEQLVWLVNEVSKKGTYVYDTRDGKFCPVNLKVGIRIKSPNGNIVSYDETDVEFLRQRVKKETLDE